MPDCDDRRAAALSVHLPVAKTRRPAPALEVCTTISPSSALSRTYFTRPDRQSSQCPLVRFQLPRLTFPRGHVSHTCVWLRCPCRSCPLSCRMATKRVRSAADVVRGPKRSRPPPFHGEIEHFEHGEVWYSGSEDEHIARSPGTFNRQLKRVLKDHRWQHPCTAVDGPEKSLRQQLDKSLGIETRTASSTASGSR